MKAESLFFLSVNQNWQKKHCLVQEHTTWEELHREISLGSRSKGRPFSAEHESGKPFQVKLERQESTAFLMLGYETTLFVN